MGKKILFMAKKFIPVSIVLVLTGVSKEGFSLWMQKREEEGSLNDFWEFPGVKVESDETPIEAASREFREEVGLECPKIEEFKVITHSYADRNVLLNVFYIHHDAEKLPKSERQKTFFINFEKGTQLLDGKMLAANYSIVESFSKYLQSNFLLEAKDTLCPLS